MPLKRIYAANFQLSSSWTCAYVPTTKNDGQTPSGSSSGTGVEGVLKRLSITSGPTEAKASVNFAYSLPSGARILGSKVYATVNCPTGGISTLTANGTQMLKNINGAYAAQVMLTATSGIQNVVFSFRTGGRMATGTHINTAYFTNVYLEIDHDGIELGEDGLPPYTGAGYSPPPQSVCIYDQDDNAIYTFDGVLKIQHSLSMDLQEEVSGDKAKDYVNNAKNEPDKLTLDVMMSDVYTGGTDLDPAGYMNYDQQSVFTATKDTVIRENRDEWGRCETFFYALHWLKEERHKLSVITPQFVHINMILSTVTVNQEDTTPFGWEGQLVFQHAFPKKKAEKKKDPPPDDKGDSDQTESGAVQTHTFFGIDMPQVAEAVRGLLGGD